ncbi:serine/threonine-protein kinase NLK2-like [Dysidea avara]|uniref:serine/threonine-protein kinase NLK2-like n=1 Tax=Dysidea avara TaxID=196820 RepID=UPI00331D2DA0
MMVTAPPLHGSYLGGYHNRLLSGSLVSNLPCFLAPSGSQVPQSSPTRYDISEEIEPERPIGYGSFGAVWAVRNPRTGCSSALKKIPNAFQSVLNGVRTFRELKVLCEFKHENLLCATDVLPAQSVNLMSDVYIVTELMESDMHQIIMSPQSLSEDHIKLFLYQILRGVKFLHSAGIIHRDLKPGNLLVNSNCLLKICDFGFARAVEPNRNTAMTLEVVTQYYRAPELLAGCKHYGPEIDIWAVGCVFAELLGRRILFEAQETAVQLEMITDLLGSPTLNDVHHVTSAASVKQLLSTRKLPQLHKLYNLSGNATHSAVHLLTQILVFNPHKRLSCAEALCHPYLEDGRMRYHSFLCNCCFQNIEGARVFSKDMEPNSTRYFDPSFERGLTSVSRVRHRMFDYIQAFNKGKAQLYINAKSQNFKQFQNHMPGGMAAGLQ